MDARLWKIGERVVDLSRRGMIMGVLNVTPDSFSDGGRFFDADTAVAHGLKMESEGADILDIGGESTRPGSEPISVEEELRRVIPVIERVTAALNAQRTTSNAQHSMALISIDTSKAAVASAAFEAGTLIVNDITGGRGDAAMMSLVAEHKAAFIIMHMQGEPKTMQVAPRYEDVVREVGNFFRQQYERAVDCGIDPMAIAFDPGIGFGKTLDHNLDLLRNLERLRVAGRPLVIGVSRKAFLGKIAAGSTTEDRLTATVALTGILRSSGSDVFRVHDVKENLAALRVADAIREK